jgi:hypothetical protein
LDLDFLPLGSGSNAERGLFWGPHHTALSLFGWSYAFLVSRGRGRGRGNREK